MLRFGISGLPPTDGDDEEFLDGLVEQGHRAYELAFVKGFPWKRVRCERFGQLAADRDIALSVHAPYFAVLTVDDEDNRGRTLAALEHTMKLGKALRATTVVAHAGYARDRTPEELHRLVAEGLARLEPKIAGLGLAVGLETSGTERAFGSLGDIALIAEQFAFVKPVIDWAHLHAASGGQLTSPEAFTSVFEFVRAQFPGWKIDPLHTQFTDNEFGPKGEIRHVPYGEGSLRIAPLIEAALGAGVRMTVISEAHDDHSHRLIAAEMLAAQQEHATGAPSDTRPLASAAIDFPEALEVARRADAFAPLGLHRPLRLSNIDKPFFPHLTKGDLIQYYASVSPWLLPHLANRGIVLARFPDGHDGDWFYEKECPSHRPDWLPTAPIHSETRGAPINFCTASDRESLMWIANLGCIEVHPWLSRLANLENPDFAVFDLDPSEGAAWGQVVEVAALVRLALERLGLRGYPKTSGATGIHIYVPLEPRYSYGRVRKFVETAGRLLEAADPGSVTMAWDISSRAGKVFVDHNQNVGGKTIASVYSVRPLPAASVSTPLEWDELDTVHPTDFTVATIWDRLSHRGDLFAPVLAGGQTLEAAEEALGIPRSGDE